MRIICLDRRGSTTPIDPLDARSVKILAKAWARARRIRCLQA